MGFRIKISDKLNRKTKKWNSIVLIDFFVSRQGILSKKILNERHKADTRLYEWITKGPHLKNRPCKFKSYK